MSSIMPCEECRECAEFTIRRRHYGASAPENACKCPCEPCRALMSGTRALDEYRARYRAELRDGTKDDAELARLIELQQQQQQRENDAPSSGIRRERTTLTGILNLYKNGVYWEGDE